jgi:hypothetical protein
MDKWTMFLPSPPVRYFSRRVAIALRVWETFAVLRWPVAYSFWASMMMRVESLVEAVEGGTPII